MLNPSVYMFTERYKINVIHDINLTPYKIHVNKKYQGISKYNTLHIAIRCTCHLGVSISHFSTIANLPRVAGPSLAVLMDLLLEDMYIKPNLEDIL